MNLQIGDVFINTDHITAIDFTTDNHEALAIVYLVTPVGHHQGIDRLLLAHGRRYFRGQAAVALRTWYENNSTDVLKFAARKREQENERIAMQAARECGVDLW